MSVLSTMISLMMKVLLEAAFALVVCCPVMCAMPFVAALTALASSTMAPNRVFVCFIEGLRIDGDVDNFMESLFCKNSVFCPNPRYFRP